MKKSKIYMAIAASLILAVLAVSCKSSPKKSKKAAAEKTPAASVVEGQEAENAEGVEGDSENAEANAENGEKTATVAEGAETEVAKTEVAKTEESKVEKNPEISVSGGSANFTGWENISSKNISESFGIIQLRVKAKFGAFSISVKGIGKSVPVLSTANEFVSNAFYLKTSRKIYALGTDRSVKTAAKRTSDGVKILYSVPSVADVLVDFKCFSSEKNVSMDMIKVTATVLNKSSRVDEFSLKSVLDTVLGESDSFHFYNWEGVPVRNEVLYRTLQNQKWFVSRNNSAAMQMFYIGADCTEPDLVALANRSTLEKNSWEPDMLSYRAFDTVLSYNDSAVCAIWKPIKLSPGESGKVIFYMGFAVDGEKLNGDKYVYVKDEPEKVEPLTPPVEKITDASVSMPYTTITATEEVIKAEPVVTETKPVANVDFYIKNMTQEHLTPEYIQSLLDRISALEEDSPSLNRQELLQLNAELDAILTYLRQ